MDNQIKQLVLMAMKKSFKSGDTLKNITGELRDQGISDELIQECFNIYYKEFNSINREDTLSDNTLKFEEWYGGPNESANSHWSKLVSILKSEKSWSEDMIKDLNSGSNAVVKKLANPQIALTESSNYHIKGLVLGYVQSGKTANYSAVISKALDAGYKFIIVLAGIHNNLRLQTETRLRKEIVEPSECSADPITRMDEHGDFNARLTSSATRVLGSSEGFGIAVLKKNASVLRKFNTWISEAKGELLKSTPVLIIDDESDQASINTKKNPDTEQTAINKQIRKIISHFRIVSYVGYTATPFASILIDTRIEDDLFPRDFIVSLKKPLSYIGAEELFGAVDIDGEIKGGLPLLRTIDQMDEEQVRASKRGEEKGFESLPQSLEYAIDCFILAGAIRISRGHIQNHISMLIHGSYLQKDQEKVHSLVEAHILLRRSEILREIPSTMSHFLEIMESDFSLTTREMGLPPDQINESDLRRNIKNFLEVCSGQIILDNSSSDRRLSFEEKFWGIVVGGNTLSRGLTIEGLTISYFVRSTKMYDSLMQMGRWFGYRPGYLDLKRIFITDELRDNFFEMASVENEIREEISVMAENQDRPSDLRIRIRQHPGMTVTARNKMGTAILEARSFAGRRALPDFLNINNDELAIQNINAVNQLLEKIHQFGCQKSDKMFSMFRTSHLYRKCPKELILQFIDDYHISAANTRANKKDIIEYLENNKKIDDWSVGIFSLISGGDQYKFKTGETVTLLDRSYAEGVHKDSDPTAFYLRGLYLPKDEMLDLANMYETDNITDALKDKNGRSIGCANIRSNIRPRNRALLAIYPLSPNSDSQERQSGPYKLKPLKMNTIQIGIMLVFPSDDDYRSGNYVVNSTV